MAPSFAKIQKRNLRLTGDHVLLQAKSKESAGHDRNGNREFPGGPVFMTWHTAMAWVQYLVPGQGTEIPQPTQRSQKKRSRQYQTQER